jgi:hypothetical protein
MSLSTVKHAADGHGGTSIVPKWTSVAPVKWVPASVTVSPPTVDPDGGLTLVNVGTGRTTKRSFEEVAEVPPGVMTCVWYCPGATEFGRLIVRSVSSVARKQFA